MFLKFVLMICVQKMVSTQINGGFWWLNDKVQRGNKIEGPKFEQVTQFDTDENDKVVFDSDYISNNDINGSMKPNKSEREGKKDSTIFQIEYGDRNSLVWHTHEDLSVNRSKANKNTTEEELVTTAQHYEDEFNFYYPDDNKIISNVTPNETNKLSTKNDSQLNSMYTDEKVFLKRNKTDQQFHESICSYMDEEECRHYDGLVYKPSRKYGMKSSLDKFQTNNYFTYPLVCCIFPVNSDEKASHKVIFLESSYGQLKRSPRSTDTDQNVALNQRLALLRRISPRFPNFKLAVPPHITERIVTPDDDNDYYVDPYDNIKNKPLIKPAKNTQYPYTKPSYGVQDYDYGPTEELPKPGLIGLYSDGQWSGSWTFENDDVVTDEEEDSDVGYGFSTVNPKLDKRKGGGASKPPQRRVPIKVSSSEESSNESVGQTVSYQSNPNFNVLQGFKLLNLIKNKSRTHTKKSRKTVTESVYNDDDSSESVIVDAVHNTGSEYDDFVVSDKQVFKECGKMWNDQVLDERQGEASYSSNPWLSLVVRNRQQRRTMCHATLVHPRAAVTAANCVHGAAPGEIILYAGVWDISEDNNKLTQRRMASVHLHPSYHPGDIGHDLAILHWNRPLRLGANVQPACMADPHVGDCCGFVGWGGRGQAINERPHWQRASVIAPRECNGIATGRLPREAFCALVKTQGCVTGIGGALVCSSNGKRAAVGVVVSRDNCDVTSPVILLPAHDWISRALSGLGIV